MQDIARRAADCHRASNPGLSGGRRVACPARLERDTQAKAIHKSMLSSTNSGDAWPRSVGRSGAFSRPHRVLGEGRQSICLNRACWLMLRCRAAITQCTAAAAAEEESYPCKHPFPRHCNHVRAPARPTTAAEEVSSNCFGHADVEDHRSNGALCALAVDMVLPPAHVAVGAGWRTTFGHGAPSVEHVVNTPLS